MRNYLQVGGTVTVTAPANVVSGDVVVVGSLVGVAAFDASQNDQVEITTEGVFTLPKKSTDVVATGNLLYWDAVNHYLTLTAGTGSKPLAGAAVAAAGNGVTTVNVKLGVHGIAGPA
jgi:predicted RecA/RadA family phage recombinase